MCISVKSESIGIKQLEMNMCYMNGAQLLFFFVTCIVSQHSTARFMIRVTKLLIHNIAGIEIL